MKLIEFDVYNEEEEEDLISIFVDFIVNIYNKHIECVLGKQISID